MTNNDQSNHNATSPTNSEAVRCGDWLGVGTRLLLEWDSSGCEAVIIAEGNGRVAVKMDWGERKIMDRTELERRKYIVLPARPKTWLQRLLTPSVKHSEPAGDNQSKP